MTRKHSKATWQCDSTWWPTLELWKWCHAPNDQILNWFATNQKMHIWNIARGTTDPGIASMTWIISSATKQANSLGRKIQVKHSIGSNFGQMTFPALVPNLPTRWRHHLVTKFVPNSSYRNNAWVRCLTDWEHGTPLKITDHDFKNFFKFG